MRLSTKLSMLIGAKARMDGELSPLLIRADASGRIGTGHIMRCIALAQAWQVRGGQVTFLSHCKSEALHQRIIDEGFDFISIENPHPDPSDLSHTLEILRQLKTQNSKLKTWVIIVGYHFTPNYQKAIRENGYRLLVIDDTAHQDHYHADILLNQNIHASSLRYYCDRDTVKLLGCEYVLLRREFLKYKDWKRVIPDKANKILVTMGGSDPDNVTLKVIQALQVIDIPDLEVKLIVGPSNPHVQELQSAISNQQSKINILHDPPNIPELMLWADIAISAGGSTCWELAFTGLPNIILILAENQTRIAEGLNNAGVAINLGWHNKLTDEKIAEAIERMITSYEMRGVMSLLGQKLVGGYGSSKVSEIMKEEIS